MTEKTGPRSEPHKEKRGRLGEIRCHNCFSRFRPPARADRASCPECGMEWHISWAGELAKIRKPVWESWEPTKGASARPVDDGP